METYPGRYKQRRCCSTRRLLKTSFCRGEGFISSEPDMRRPWAFRPWRPSLQTSNSGAHVTWQTRANARTTQTPYHSWGAARTGLACSRGQASPNRVVPDPPRASPLSGELCKGYICTRKPSAGNVIERGRKKRPSSSPPHHGGRGETSPLVYPQLRLLHLLRLCHTYRHSLPRYHHIFTVKWDEAFSGDDEHICANGCDECQE